MKIPFCEQWQAQIFIDMIEWNTNQPKQTKWNIARQREKDESARAPHNIQNECGAARCQNKHKTATKTSHRIHFCFARMHSGLFVIWFCLFFGVRLCVNDVVFALVSTTKRCIAIDHHSNWNEWNYVFDAHSWKFQFWLGRMKFGQFIYQSSRMRSTAFNWNVESKTVAIEKLHKYIIISTKYEFHVSVGWLEVHE